MRKLFKIRELGTLGDGSSIGHGCWVWVGSDALSPFLGLGDGRRRMSLENAVPPRLCSEFGLVRVAKCSSHFLLFRRRRFRSWL